MDDPLPRRPTPAEAVEIPSDNEEGGGGGGGGNGEQVLVIDDDDDDDPVPREMSTPDSNYRQDATPLFVPETPGFASVAPILIRPCSTTSVSFAPSLVDLICLESDDEGDGNKNVSGKTSPRVFSHARIDDQSKTSSFHDEISPANDFTEMPTTTSYELAADEFDIGSRYRVGHEPTASVSQDLRCMEIRTQEHSDHIHQNSRLECDLSRQKTHGRVTTTSFDKSEKEEEVETKRKKKEEKLLLNEERKRKRQEQRLQKEALKAEEVQRKKLQKEKNQWEKGKFALKSIIAEIDVKVVENGAVGGHLLSRFAEKGLTYNIKTNPMEKSILWRMSIPDHISELSSMGAEVPYVAFVYEAEEFCNLLLTSSFQDHIYKVKRQYPSFTACYITNKLMSYVKRREQNRYRNPSEINYWQRPPIEEVMAKLTTDFDRVHSRLCTDEADLAEHIVGLTSSLAACRFRKKWTWLSVNANGSLVPKGFIDKNVIRKSSWLKALVAVPRVQPRFAIAISKKYPTMRSLLNEYMDPQKSVHEKEFLLKDLIVEGEPGKENKRVGEACSKRIYRILMARNGVSKADDVENGADYF